MIQGPFAIAKELSIQAVRGAIGKRFKTGKNPGVDPNFMDIFQYGFNLEERHKQVPQAASRQAPRTHFQRGGGQNPSAANDERR